VRKSILLKLMLATAFPMFATEDETGAVAPTTDAPTVDALPVGDAVPVDPAVGSNAAAPAPVVQTQPPVDQPGNVNDPVLETVKTPAHSVAEEIKAEIQKLEQLPAEVAAWFESKFVELASHIKALL
jgi:hypothetical protein